MEEVASSIPANDFLKKNTVQGQAPQLRAICIKFHNILLQPKCQMQFSLLSRKLGFTESF